MGTIQQAGDEARLLRRLGGFGCLHLGPALGLDLALLAAEPFIQARWPSVSVFGVFNVVPR
jgi:hypothetical protein